jgi:hypothetical protein
MGANNSGSFVLSVESSDQGLDAARSCFIDKVNRFDR